MMTHRCLEVFVVLTIFALCVSHTDAANILTIFPTPAKSHWFALRPMFEELSRRGHNVTLITAYMEKDFPPQWEIILIPEIWPASMVSQNTISVQVKGWALYDLLVEFGLQMCEDLFKEEALQNLINTEEKRFDLFIMEHFDHSCFLAFAHKFSIPVIGLSSFGGFVWTTDAVGDPYPVSYVPDVLSDFTDHMTFYQRLVNFFTMLYARYLYYYRYIPKTDEIVNKYFKDPTMPSIAEIEANTSLLIIQTHMSIAYPRPHLPNVIETAGMHIQRPKPLPEDLQKLLDDSKDGVIYFSMGSIVKSADFPEEKIEAFLSVFSKLKQIVLWKWETDNLPGKPPNVKLAKWFPQSDLLAHKNVQLFISHGGLQSTLEATARGVPLIGIPIGAEQRYNVQRTVTAGYCIRLDLDNVTAQSVEWAVSQILTNPTYREKAKLRSELFHDRPQSPVDTAVYWTEYVLRHKGARHLRSAALDLAWYQYMLLDVIALLVFGAAALLLTVVLAVRAVYRLIIGTTSSSHVQNKRKNVKKD